MKILLSVLLFGIFVSLISFADAENAYDICTSTPGSETLTREELDECVRDTEQWQELHKLQTESRHAETYNMQILALGGTITACAIIGIIILKFVILKKIRK